MILLHPTEFGHFRITHVGGNRFVNVPTIPDHHLLEESCVYLSTAFQANAHQLLAQFNFGPQSLTVARAQLLPDALGDGTGPIPEKGQRVGTLEEQVHVDTNLGLDDHTLLQLGEGYLGREGLRVLQVGSAR
jgi:hypothetical protein